MARITLGDRLSILANSEHLNTRDRKFAGDLLSYYKRKKCLTAGRRVWVDRLEAKVVAEAKFVAAGPPPVSPEFVTCLERIEAAEGKDSWAFKFLSDMVRKIAGAYPERGMLLSPKQQFHVDNLLTKYSDEAMVEAGRWASNYSKNHKAQAKALANYYRTNKLPYWKDMVSNILDVEGYVPSREAYTKMSNNKYAQRTLSELSREPTFSVRASVQLRQNQTTRRLFRSHLNKKGFVLQVGQIKSAVRGGRVYTVLFVGNPRPVEVEERYLKVLR
jgi:hypothetical protein